MSALVLLLSLPLALFMILVGFAKLQRLPASLGLAHRVGVNTTRWRLWGVVDLVCAGALILGSFASNPLALVAAIVIAISMLLLLVIQAKAQEPLAFMLPAMVVVVLASVDVAAITVQM